MGSEVIALLERDETLSSIAEITCVLNREKPLRSIDIPVDVWIDFSVPQSTLNLLGSTPSPVVIGTTGFDPDQLARVEHFSGSRAILLSANMSFGIESMSKMAKLLPRHMGGDVFLIEEHHRSKRDKPSGTALLFEKSLREAGFSDVAIHSVRAGGVVGVHQIRWVTDNEEVTISHRAFNRSVFAKGAILAAIWLNSKPSGLYKISDLWRTE